MSDKLVGPEETVELEPALSPRVFWDSFSWRPGPEDDCSVVSRNSSPLAARLDETEAGIGEDGSSSLTEGTGGISPLSLRRRAFFFGVVDVILTGVDEADDRGESTLISIVFC